MSRMCLIVEDQHSVREYFCEVIRRTLPSIYIQTVSDIKGARQWFRHRKPGDPSIAFCFVDLGLPDGSGTELIREIRAHDPSLHIVVITMYDDDAHLFEALAAGASGYLLKEESLNFHMEALRRLEGGEPPLSPAIARRLVTHFRAPSYADIKKARLSAREAETLGLLAKGMTVPEAAKHMGLSAQTVAGYVKVIYQKLHVSNKVEAINEGLRQGLLKAENSGT